MTLNGYQQHYGKRGHNPRLLAAKLSRACVSITRQGSREFSDEWLHEERAARRRNVHLHAKRLKF
jgi:hypothetical protein